MNNLFQKLIENRRSIYAIGKQVQLSNEQLTTLIQQAIIYAPSAFNSQSSRAVILFGDEHEKFWQLVFEKLQEFLSNDDAIKATQQKIASFAAGVGTVLFFEDQEIVQRLQEQFPLYADNFPVWSEHSTAIAQFAVWTALAEQGIGASLQHYNPIIDNNVHAEWEIPSNWKLRAQLVFGSIEAAAGEKSFIDNDTRFKVFQ
ncbi:MULTISPECIES: nitroreductase family protein [unclassified Acinetobacter]|uniref:nitroreductase family protein n=1 Tax=unclassified Acinetobacter TaxID=196816 RepID=UPI0029347641|nr:MULTISPECIES: nitroreductase family protein [unclassified Acinetobacter]WOE30595.1 nitroreductase family protein [Acinetobacter sp. SAAs470]WOE38787.1 nitroreductase family protein [Acinetobacter sp. SAAs474]